MKNKKIVFIIVAVVIMVIMALGFCYMEYLKNDYNKKNTETLKPESIDDIPANIVDYIAPDVEQKFKALAKNFHVYDKDGNEIELSDYKGKAVVINFWSSYSKSSTEEIPNILEAMDNYKDDVEFLMINLSPNEVETRAMALKYIQENNFNINPLFDDHGEVAIDYNVTSLPRTIFIDKEGYIQKSSKGTLNKEYLDEQIKKIIEDK